MTVTVTPASPGFSDAASLARARHVFLGGTRLTERWCDRDAFVVLETGFGIGLNFLATWEAMRAHPGRPRRLHFISVEPHPLAREDLRAALARFPELAALSHALVEAWPPPLAGFHRIHFDNGQVILTLLLGDAGELLPQLEASVDAFYLDEVTPAKNHAIWSSDTVRSVAAHAAPGATLATGTVAGGVRSLLADAGFRIEKREAAGDELLAGSWREPAVARVAPQRSAVVIGSGLAGVMCADRLVARGWSVALVDARPARESATVGLVRPIVNLRDAMNARISRGAFLYALQHYRALQSDGYHLQWDRCGVLQLAGDDDEATRFKAIVESHGYPPEFLRYVERGEASALAGRDVARAGWWFAAGAWVSLPSLAIASLARAGERVTKRMGQRVDRIEREGADWRALDAGGRVIAEAPVMILANAFDAKRLVPEARLSLSAVRGQVTYLPADASRPAGVIVSGNGYVSPLPDGGHCIGASYQHDDPDASVRAADHRDNLARAESLLPGFTANVHPMALDGWTGYRATVPDRLPIFGATSTPGLHVATGLGSRGLLWAPVGAERLACALESEPSPLPRDYGGALSPLRFLS